MTVKVHPHSKRDMLVKTSPDRFEAWVRAKPIDGHANEVVISLLVRYLNIPRGRLQLVKGRAGRQKVFKVLG